MSIIVKLFIFIDFYQIERENIFYRNNLVLNMFFNKILIKINMLLKAPPSTFNFEF